MPALLDWLAKLPQGGWGPRELLLTATAVVLVYVVGLGIYRLSFHALSSIPGPRLMALSYWPEFYYDVLLGGQYFRVIDDMHRKYGPIVRVNPNEVHFNDPEFIDTLFPLSGRRTNKPIQIGKRTGTPDSMVTTVDHDVHRRRRNAVNAFFSNNSIRRMEPILQERLRTLLRRIRSGEPNKALEMHPVFRACTNDVITTYAFGRSLGLLDRADFGVPYFEASDVFFRLEHLFGHFHWLADLVQALPFWLVPMLFPSLQELVAKQAWWMDRIREIRGSADMSKAKDTIFQGILSGGLPEEDVTDKRLLAEAQLIVFAGEGTTAYTLTAAMYELLANPPVLEKLQRELAEAIPDRGTMPSFVQVESLPYLNAVIQETVRLHPGVMARQARISPDLAITYKGKYTLPPGTIFSMSPLTTHMNADVFQDPHVFRPERWIDNPRIGRAFLGFARGSRNCVGMNLARKEMALVLATLFRMYDLYRGQDGPTVELYDTERARDIDPNHDYIIPFPAKGSKGLRVIFRH